MKLNQFAEVAEIIKASRNKAIKAVNTQLIDLYWSIGKYIDIRIENPYHDDRVEDTTAG